MCVKLLIRNLNNLVCFTIILNSLIQVIFYLVIILILIILIDLIVRLIVGSSFDINILTQPRYSISIS